MLNDDQKFGKNENFRVFSGSAGRPLPDGRLTAHFFSARLGGAPSVFRLAGSAASAIQLPRIHPISVGSAPGVAVLSGAGHVNPLKDWYCRKGKI